MKIDLEIPKAGKVILFCLLSTIIIFLIFINIWSYFFAEKPRDFFLRREYNRHFSGKVDSIYHDKANHNTKVAVLNNGYLYLVYSDWEAKIEKGDSLCKEEKSPFLIIYKKNGDKITLDYRILLKDW